MIIGVGTDLLSLARLTSVLTRHPPRLCDRFARRILAPQDILKYQRALLKDDKVALTILLARHWTSKEAAYKAFHPRVALRWHDLSLRYQPPMNEDSQGAKPELTLSGRYAAMNDHYRIHLSLTHDADLMMAFVVVEERRAAPNYPPPNKHLHDEVIY